MNAFEKFLHHLPPEQRADAAMMLDQISSNPESPIFGMEVAMLNAYDNKLFVTEKRLSDKLDECLANQKVIPPQIRLTEMEIKKIIREEISDFYRTTLIIFLIIIAFFWVSLFLCIHYRSSTNERSQSSEFQSSPSGKKPNQLYSR
jgi:hypothetical protein